MGGALNLGAAIQQHLPTRAARILRRSPGSRVAGRVVIADAVDIGEIAGTRAVATDKILKQLGEGLRSAGMLVFRTQTELCLLDETTGQPSDHLRFSDGEYRVVALADYPGHGLRRYILAEVRP